MQTNALYDFNPLLALAFGTFVGLLAQTIASRLRHNGKWEDISSGRKWAMRWTGAFAAYGVGLWILDHPVPGSESPYVYRLWLYQLAAAWGGTAVLDMLVQILLQILRNIGKNQNEDKDDDDDA